MRIRILPNGQDAHRGWGRIDGFDIMLRLQRCSGCTEKVSRNYRPLMTSKVLNQAGTGAMRHQPFGSKLGRHQNPGLVQLNSIRSCRMLTAEPDFRGAGSPNLGMLNEQSGSSLRIRTTQEWTSTRVRRTDDRRILDRCDSNRLLPFHLVLS
jgi:hypothetical protein